MGNQLNSELASIFEIVKRQKEIANKICIELELQNKLVSKITRCVDNKEFKIASISKSIPISRTWNEYLKSWF
jgi:hypothetical protein